MDAVQYSSDVSDAIGQELELNLVPAPETVPRESTRIETFAPLRGAIVVNLPPIEIPPGRCVTMLTGIISHRGIRAINAQTRSIGRDGTRGLPTVSDGHRDGRRGWDRIIAETAARVLSPPF